MPEFKHPLVLSLLSKYFAICKLAPDAALPEWAMQGQFYSVTRTADEVSIVVEMELVPDSLRPEIVWRVLKVHGPFAFSEVGVLTSLVVPLAEAQIGVFTISTFDTDYLLVDSRALSNAVATLRKAGHTVHDAESIS